MNKDSLVNTIGLAGMLYRLRNRCGLTMAEVLIVMLIIGILCAIVITLYIGHIDKSKRAAAVQNLRSIQLLMEHYKNEKGCYYDNCSLKLAPVLTNSAITQLLPDCTLSKDDGLKYNYSVRITNFGKNFIVGAALVPDFVTAGVKCLPGEMKIFQDNKQCGF
ncbi:MAG: type II secretion system protein [Nitrospirae bacterium]|nr:type II secretion system protein [Nitrospirota bacterium]